MVGDNYKDLDWSLALAQLQRTAMSAGSDPGLCYRYGEGMGRGSGSLYQQMQIPVGVCVCGGA